MGKNVYVFLLICLLVLVAPVTSKADTQWKSPSAPVDSKKVWNITFSKSVDESTIRNETIYILDGKGHLQSTTAILSNTNSRRVIVKPPKDGYVENRNYVLHISSNLKSTNQKSLTDDVFMNFSIQDSVVQKTVLGTWKTSYKGLHLITTFNQDYTSLVRLGEIEEKGKYKIEGADMTMTVLGETRTGRIEKKSTNAFTITSPFGSVMEFTR